MRGSGKPHETVTRLKANENPSQFTSDIFKSERVVWTAPTGTKQTYHVTQRTDIDWNQIRTDGRREYIGKTNLEAARMGHRPQLSDGHFATLHHLGQDSRGALIEASTKYHSFKSEQLANGKKSFDILHGQHGYRKPNPEFPVNHTLFELETKAYWKNRAKELK